MGVSFRSPIYLIGSKVLAFLSRSKGMLSEIPMSDLRSAVSKRRWARNRATMVEAEYGMPEVFEPLLEDGRYKGAYGGRGSAKSWFFADLLITRASLEPGLRVVCIREIQKSLEQSVKRLLEDRIAARGLGSRFRILKTHIETPGGGLIIFQGMQNHTAESIKSLEGYDVAWVEEAQSLSERSLSLLRPTIRKEGSEIWFSWNPRNRTDPVDVFLREDPPADAIVVEANYLDNPHFPEPLRREMEWDKAHDIDKYNHIWMGHYEEFSTARIFKNWREEYFDTPLEAVFLYGADWGFSSDPTCLIRCWEKDPRTLMVDGEAWGLGVEIDDTPDLFDLLDGGKAREYECIADSARPETISYMKKHGYPRVVPSKKGQGSVKEGVAFLQSYKEIIIHTRCSHTLDEFRAYKHPTDPTTGVIIPKLPDKDNHCIDALRYAVEKKRHASKAKAKVW